MSSSARDTQEREFSPGRRAFLRLRKDPEADLLRPPWTDADLVAARCTACGACEAACPEKIIRSDSRGRPFIVFGQASGGVSGGTFSGAFDGRECTFCGQCAQTCEAGVFDLARAPPWEQVARITEGCLQDRGVSCHLCRDTCPVSAIRIDLEKRPFGRLKIDAQTCTGCGACLGACPQEAVTLSARSTEKEVA